VVKAGEKHDSSDGITRQGLGKEQLEICSVKNKQWLCELKNKIYALKDNH
jgi:hypothetical protein